MTDNLKIKPGPNVTRTAVEMNLGWADQNPELFIQKFRDIGINYPSREWNHRLILSRPGYVVIDIERK